MSQSDSNTHYCTVMKGGTAFAVRAAKAVVVAGMENNKKEPLRNH